MSVKVKICGVCTVEDARVVAAAGADFLGLNFHSASPRYVSVERACEIAEAVRDVALVGVFVDATRERVEEIAGRVGLSALQFHGDEDPGYCRGWGWRTIKALRARPGADLGAQAAAYAVDYVLVDSFVPGMHGGTGKVLDPGTAGVLPSQRLFLAGGLRPETVADAVRSVRPFAVDVASGVEERPGRKDHGKIEEFIRRAKSA